MHWTKSYHGEKTETVAKSLKLIFLNRGLFLNVHGKVKMFVCALCIIGL